jgi:flagellar hook-associated protein 1 FlgK
MGGVLQIGKSGMQAARAGVSTAGHNIANANAEGYSRQRVHQSAEKPAGRDMHATYVGRGTKIERVDRVNNEYIDRQLRTTGRDLAFAEEREVILRQTEDIFNEMNGEGLNRLMSKFFNEFRKLSSEPENLALRESVRESANALVNDFRRLKAQINDVSSHIDSRVEGHVREINQLSSEICDLNVKISQIEIAGGSPNDLLDQRDRAVKKLGALVDVSCHKEKDGALMVELRGLGPLITTRNAEQFTVARTPANGSGKPSNAFDVYAGQISGVPVTERLTTGKLGALLKTRDETLATMSNKMDIIAYELSRAVNEVHRMGFTRDGISGVDFFRPLEKIDGASDGIMLSDALRASSHNIAAAGQPDSPGDNRVALAISGLQGMRLLDGGKATVDDFYNSIVAEVGVTANQNKATLNQNRDVMTQLSKMREQVSGVSIDEETTQLMQYQHAFDASARVIHVADELMKTVLDLKR